MTLLYTGEEYLADVSRTIANGSTKAAFLTAGGSDMVSDIFHGAVGLVTETAGELIEFAQESHMVATHNIPNSSLRINLMEELGDCYWYIGIMARAMNIKLELSSRYTVCDKPHARHAAMTITPLIRSSGELLDIIKKSFYGKPLDAQKLASAIKRTEKFLCVAIANNGFSVNQVRMGNIAKLALRYGDKFDEKSAYIRNTKAEMDAMLAAGDKYPS